MSSGNHANAFQPTYVQEFLSAVRGKKGELDAWLECNNEEAVRTCVLGALAAQRDQIVAWIEPQRNDVPAMGQEFASALRIAEEFQ